MISVNIDQRKARVSEAQSLLAELGPMINPDRIDPDLFACYIPRINQLLKENQETAFLIFEAKAKGIPINQKIVARHKELAKILKQIIKITPKIYAALPTPSMLATPLIEQYLGPDAIQIVEQISLFLLFLAGLSWTIAGIFTLDRSSENTGIQIPASAIMTFIAFSILCVLVIHRKKWARSRYLKEVSKICEASSGKPNQVLILIAKDILSVNAMDCSGLELSRLRSLAKTHSIHHIAVSKHQESCPIPKGEQYDKVELHAHSTPHEILLGENCKLTEQNTDEWKQLGCAVRYGGILTFYSCCAGNGEDNIAKQASLLCPHGTIYASKEEVGFRNYIHKDAEGNPRFKAADGTDATRVYKRGQQVQPKLKHPSIDEGDSPLNEYATNSLPHILFSERC